MTYKNRVRAVICLAMAVMLLLAVAAAPVSASAEGTTEPIPTPENPGTCEEVTVDNIDDFLAAIASNTVITLEPGTYDLAAAKDYGDALESGPYTWVDAYDGYELVIRGVDDLVIAGQPGEDSGEIVFSADPRYAQVLRFENCKNLTLSAFTAGHTQEPGQCAGGVLYFDSCINIHLSSCRLYGCGILGIRTVNCDTLRADDCAVYDCSIGAVMSTSSRDVRLINCDFYDCGGKDGYAGSMFEVQTTTGFAVVNSRVHDNDVICLLRSTSSDEVYLLGTEVTGNQFETFFSANLIAPIVGACSFSGNTVPGLWFEGLDYALTPEGETIGRQELRAMALDHSAYEYGGPKPREAAAVTGIPAQDGMEYHVTTVDEFLAAIGSDTTIYLDGEMFDLSTAANYGGYGGEHYYWVDIYDGPGLVITGVQNLRIIGQGKDKTTVEAVPRYADVLRFEKCRHVTVAQLTAGHTKGEPSSCAGDVLAFEMCQDVYVVDCGLFGCGVFGIRANNSIMGNILRTEIYECSQGAASFMWTDGFVFTDCSVHDCSGQDWGSNRIVPCNIIQMMDSGDCSYNGTPLLNGVNEVGDGGPAGPVDYTAEPAAVVPDKPSDDASIQLFYYETKISEDEGFTMHVGDEPITLQAMIRLNDHFYLGEFFEWGVSDPNAFWFKPSENGLYCEFRPLSAVEGATVLTVTAPEIGTTLSIPVYVVD